MQVCLLLYKDQKVTEVEFVLEYDTTAGFATLSMEDIRPLKSMKICMPETN
jgi:hypothetical protein